METLLIATEAEGGGLHFPPIGELVVWPNFLLEGSEYFAVNKIVLAYWISTILTLLIFTLAGKDLVPRGLQNIAESSVDFIKDQIVMQTIGPDGMRFVPFFLSMFFFLLFNNLFEIIPGWQMPSTARMALPAFLALLVWVIFNVVGVASQGLGGYLKSSLFPPGVPTALYLLVTPIEFISTFVVRPFSLAVRLFANMLAGHLLLVTFAVLTAAMWSLTPLLVIAPFSFFMLVFLTAFELLVAFLQAYIFTILTAVYIGGAMHPDH